MDAAHVDDSTRWCVLKLNDPQNPMVAPLGLTGGSSFTDAWGAPPNNNLGGHNSASYTAASDQCTGLNYFQLIYGRVFVKRTHWKINILPDNAADNFMVVVTPVTIFTKGVTGTPFNTSGVFTTMRAALEAAQAKGIAFEPLSGPNIIKFSTTNQEVFGLKETNQQLIGANNYSCLSGAGPNVVSGLQMLITTASGATANASSVSFLLTARFECVFYDRSNFIN